MKLTTYLIALLILIGGLSIGYMAGHRQPAARSAQAPVTFPPAASMSGPLAVSTGNKPSSSTGPSAYKMSARDLFGPEDEPAPPAPIIVAPPILRVPPAAPVDPLQHYTYTGSATYGDSVYAMLQDDRSSVETTYSEGDMVEGYKITSILPEAVTLRLGKQDRRLIVSDRFNPVPMIATAPKDVRPNPGNLTEYRSKTYQSFFFQVTGASSGSIWGSGSVYTDDSALATAAVHAGVLKEGEAGVVRVTVLPGYDHYDGATSNGVTSQSYAEWQGSYRVDRL